MKWHNLGWKGRVQRVILGTADRGKQSQHLSFARAFVRGFRLKGCDDHLAIKPPLLFIYEVWPLYMVWCSEMDYVPKKLLLTSFMINSAFFSPVFSDISRGLAKPRAEEHAQVSLACER